MRQFSRRSFVTACGAGILLADDSPASASPITNRWGEARTTRLDLEEIVIYKGPPGAAYNHHHQIVCDRGRLYASWSNSVAHEDNPGQRMLFAISDDDGKTWSSEAQLSPASPDKTSTFTAMGIRSHRGELIAYYGHFAYNPIAFDAAGVVRSEPILENRGDNKVWVRRNTYCEVRVSKDRGKSWSKPARILDGFVPNLRPFPLESGRLLMPANITFAYTDDPAGLNGWRKAGLPRLPEWMVDDPEGFLKGCSYRQDPRDYCEGSFFQTGDGKIHMMLRTLPLAGQKHNGLLAVTESVDNGQTWSEPRLTGYTDCSCRFHFGRLPDGRFFGLSCPKPGSGRTPMVLALSRDGVVFDRHYVLGDLAPTRPRQPGQAKGGTYGYPSCEISGGRMYIIFSRNKEDICFKKLNLDLLS
jgi:hypothetical protein